MTVYFVRHGHREDWGNPDWKSTALRPQDPALSATGVAQAQEVAAYLAGPARPHCIRHIFASPFVRVLQTATAIADALDLPINVENGVIEWLIEGHDVDPLPLDVLAARFPRINAGYRSHMDLPRGEDRVKLQQRADRIMKHIVETYCKEGEDVLIISHAAPIIMLARALVADPRARINVATCSVSRLERIAAAAALDAAAEAAETAGAAEAPAAERLAQQHARSHQRQEPRTAAHRWQFVLNGHTDHLSQGSLMDWQFPEDREQ